MEKYFYFPFSNREDYGKKYFYIKQVLPKPSRKEIYIKDNLTKKNEYYIFDSSKAFEYNYPAINVYCLPNVTLIPETQGYIQNEYYFNDLIYQDLKNRFDLRFGNLLFLNRKKVVLFSQSNVLKKYETGISLIGFAPYNYFHFTIEIVTKLVYFEKIEIDESVPIVLDEAIRNYSQLIELIELMNGKKRKILFINKKELSLFKTLYVCDDISLMPINRRPFRRSFLSDYKFDFYPIKKIRQRALSGLLGDEVKPENLKVYLCRKNLKSSRLLNENKVIRLLQANNFLIINMEDLSFKNQVRLFWNASIIIGATGAAFTNIIYCNPSVKIFCINPVSFHFYGFSTLAYNLGLKFNFIDARTSLKSFGRASSSAQFKVDIKNIKIVINEDSI